MGKTWKILRGEQRMALYGLGTLNFSGITEIYQKNRKIIYPGLSCKRTILHLTHTGI